jgi:hypothetical protein
MITFRRKRLSRNGIDTSDKVLVRQWRKRLGKSAQEVEAAVAKVGSNVESVTKELETKPR